MAGYSHFRLQLIVFALVSASFTNVYITQPVLPILQREFAVDLVLVSFSVSAVILGIAVANLPFGMLADRLPIHPIVAVGGFLVAGGGLICAVTTNLWVLIGARFLQGLFIPALTTCLAAYLAKTLPAERLSVVMGSYVSATVVGGLGGRLLGGFIHPLLHWRYAFVSAAALILIATLAALWSLPRTSADTGRRERPVGFLALLKNRGFLRIYACAAGSFAIFSTVFNYLPFRLAAPPFHFSTEMTTLLYLVYVVGIFMGPLAGKFSNRVGSGSALLVGSAGLGLGLAIVSLPWVTAVILGLLVLCAGFFMVHAVAVGTLNRRLSSGQGRANALYVMFYYLGGWMGITGSGFAYKGGGWEAVVGLCLMFLIVPLWTGMSECRSDDRCVLP